MFQVDKAMDCVFGYTVAHDVSARDWQFKNGGQFLLGKSMDGFCPLGPAIVMKEDLKGRLAFFFFFFKLKFYALIVFCLTPFFCSLFYNTFCSFQYYPIPFYFTIIFFFKSDST